MKKDYFVENQMEKFADFTEGVRVLMLTQRSKEGGRQNKPDRLAKKYVVNGKEEFRTMFELMYDIMKDDDRPLRIYCPVNSRNTYKAIHHFKQLQLDNDYVGQEEKENFYFDIKNRWISSLMQRKCKAESNFLIDCDGGDELDDKQIRNLLHIEGIETLLEYPTKNGYHFITKPFNPAKFPQMKINPDGQMLLGWNNPQ